MSIEIEEQNVNISLKFNKFSILVTNFVLNVGCDLVVTMFDENNIAVKQEVLPLLKEEYAQWANDDNFIIQYVCEYFGFVKKIIVEPVPEEIVEPVPE